MGCCCYVDADAKGLLSLVLLLYGRAAAADAVAVGALGDVQLCMAVGAMVDVAVGAVAIVLECCQIHENIVPA